VGVAPGGEKRSPGTGEARAAGPPPGPLEGGQGVRAGLGLPLHMAVSRPLTAVARGGARLTRSHIRRRRLLHCRASLGNGVHGAVRGGQRQALS